METGMFMVAPLTSPTIVPDASVAVSQNIVNCPAVKPGPMTQFTVRVGTSSACDASVTFPETSIIFPETSIIFPETPSTVQFIPAWTASADADKTHVAFLACIVEGWWYKDCLQKIGFN